MTTKKQPWLEKASVQAALINTIPAFLVAIVGICFTWLVSEKQLNQSENIFKQQMIRDSILNLIQTQLTVKQLELNRQELELVKKQTQQDSINLLFNKNQNDNLNNQKSITTMANWFEFTELVSSIGDQIDLYHNSDTMKNIEDTLKSDYYSKRIGIQKGYTLTLIQLFNKGLNNPIINSDKNIWDLWENSLNNLKGIKSWIATDSKLKFVGHQKQTIYWNKNLFNNISHNYFQLQVLIQEKRTNNLLN